MRIRKWAARHIMCAYLNLLVDPCIQPHSYAQMEPSSNNKYLTVTGGKFLCGVKLTSFSSYMFILFILKAAIVSWFHFYMWYFYII